MKTIEDLWNDICDVNKHISDVCRKYDQANIFNIENYADEDYKKYFKLFEQHQALVSEQLKLVPQEALDKLKEQFPDIDLLDCTFSLTYFNDIAAMVPPSKDGTKRFPLWSWHPDHNKWGMLPLGA